MSVERLFEVIGLVDDSLLEEAERYRPPQKSRHWARWCALAACAVLIVGGAWLVRGGRLGASSGGAPGSAPAPGGAPGADSALTGGREFMSYAGPVLPLSAEGDLAGLTAEREVTYKVGEESVNSAEVSDRYILTNSNGDTKTLVVYYPYVESLRADEEHTPVLTLDGEELETELVFGAYAGGFQGAEGGYNLKQPNSWGDYQTLLESGDYLKDAKAAEMWPDCPVTVYTFHDVSAPKDNHAATLAIDFTLPAGSNAMTYGMNGMSVDEERGWYQFSYFIDQPNTNQRVVILGTPPEEYRVAGYVNGDCDAETSAVTGRVEQSESTLYQIFRDCLADNERQSGEKSMLPEETRLRAALSFLQYTGLGEISVGRYDFLMLEDLISETMAVDRVLYRTAVVTVPAGGSVELAASYRKDGSHDFGHGSAENRGVEGYDLATTLGSVLHFTSQRARLELPSDWRIVGQSFGFDPSDGVTEVELSLDVEHYYIEISRERS